MPKYTDAQAKAVKKYLHNIGEIKVRTSKEDMARYRDYAKSVGSSLNQLFLQAINEKIERDSE